VTRFVVECETLLGIAARAVSGLIETATIDALRDE
jgi:hypothetical protein